jgi:hypothetical protein
MPKSFTVVVAPIYSCLVFGFGDNSTDSTYSTVFKLGFISVTISHDKEQDGEKAKS